MYTQREEARPWFEAGDSLDARSAFRSLIEQSDEHRLRKRCVYVHIPYCESICSFCALYTRAVRHDQHAVFDGFLQQTLLAIQTHPYAGLGTVPTTVHFGGGTPLQIGAERLRDTVAALRDAFGSDDSTEWAIEVTTSSISNETLQVLGQLGFRRIHLGIQTLNDDIRQSCGRRETKRQCLEKVQMVRQAGFLLSVDLILGLEGMTESVITQDLELLYDAGVRMFSLCELRHRSKRQYTHLHTQDRIEQNRRLWHLVWSFMAAHRLRPIHIGQFGRDQADNLYFTHPARHEDCIAIGPYAHGSIGSFYYANKLLPEYLDSPPASDALIQHAVRYPYPVQTIRRLESELLSHTISADTAAAVERCYGEPFASLLENWFDCGYLQQENRHGYTLSCDGSWYVGNMCLHLRQLPVLLDPAPSEQEPA